MRRQPTIEERNAIASARQRADSVYAMLGRETPSWMPGESPLAFRQRLADGLKDHSAPLRRANLAALPEGAFSVTEARIYQDATAAAQTGAGIPRGTLRPHAHKDETGHNVTDYYGDPMGWMSPFMAPGAVARIRRPGEL
jgi:hypothetical protein